LTLSDIEEEEKYAGVTGYTTQRQHPLESFPKTDGSDQMSPQSHTEDRLVASFTVKDDLTKSDLKKLSDSKSFDNLSVGLRASSLQQKSPSSWISLANLKQMVK